MAKKQKNPVLRQSFKYRSYCNKGTHRRLVRTMVAFSKIWNADVKQRRETYYASKIDESIKPINSYKDPRSYALIKGKGKYPGINKWVLQDVLVKVDSSQKSYYELFKKWKSNPNRTADGMPRPPQEKGIHRCIVYRLNQNGKFSGATWDGKNLHCDGIGRLKVRMHRPIEGKIKTISVTLNRGRLFVCFSCVLPLPVVPEKKKKSIVSIIMGGGVFISDSNGGVVSHPRFYESEIQRLRTLSRSLSRKKKGSANRRKAKYTLSKWHEHIANKRKHFVESLVNEYVSKYDIIEISSSPLKPQIQYALTSKKAMRLCDAGYGLFLSDLKHKCNECGKELNIRKDESWKKEIETLTEVARLVALRKKMVRVKRELNSKQRPEVLTSLRKALTQAGTLQICSQA